MSLTLEFVRVIENEDTEGDGAGDKISSFPMLELVSVQFVMFVMFAILVLDVNKDDNDGDGA